MDHLAPFSYPKGEIEARVKFSLSTLTSGLATDSGH
jgi:hypothetical protein